jgi:glc operon protein GlcG
MDNTHYGSIRISQIKAKSAAIYRRPSHAFAGATAKGRVALVGLPEMFGSPGWSPRKIIGGVGVNGV